MRFGNDFYQRDALEVASNLIGQSLVRVFKDGCKNKYVISEVEAYGGEDDLACHASKGRTSRTEIMYHEGGHVYVYLIYGMYWMLNFVTSIKNVPQAVLIRGFKGIDGPGKITMELGINRSFYGENLATSERMWVEKREETVSYKTYPRINIDYAGEVWKKKQWRYVLV